MWVCFGLKNIILPKFFTTAQERWKAEATLLFLLTNLLIYSKHIYTKLTSNFGAALKCEIQITN